MTQNPPALAAEHSNGYELLESKETYESVFPSTQKYFLKELIFHVILPAKLSLPKMISFPLRFKYYLSHSTRCIDIGHTGQQREGCRNPPARTRKAPTINPAV